ncbi:hypothetical protein Pla108_11240 [Botrimarina colliarenosi]|uniref:Winged helix-turn-helix domain-containing protein n=1 Tax=Botrimarina colliarenosi TaxID=2528001 RepID=A0A5C6ALN4_9BACT|nr:winged helix-turn-helix domain-containing protein [Botrimarina colliarenosi]TWU00179.1 hypothetical protein Pla108_11240 [Botrimarina colliarenosi]
MAKKTAKKAAAPKPAAEKATKQVPPTPTAAPVTTKVTPAAAPAAYSSDAIGYAAGDVWGALHGKGWQTLAAVKKASDCPADLTLMAVGWLAREGKLDFAVSGRSVKVTLKG